MDEHGKLYWHDAFFEALQLELHQYRDALEFIYEHQLSKEALRMDVLVIKKDSDIKIEKNIGRIFKKCNIFEYKSETDSFSVWDYNKILGYAYFYSSFERIPMSEITLSIALTMYPRELVKFLKNERGLVVKGLGDGIYYVEGDAVPVQILESKRLPPDGNLFLRNLRSGLSSEEMLSTLQSYKTKKRFNEKNAYLDKLVRANLDVFKEATNMSEDTKKMIANDPELVAILEGLLAERIEQRKKEAAKEAVKKAVKKAAKKTAKKTAKETGKKMLQDGESAEKIARWTGLPVEEVLKLQ